MVFPKLFIEGLATRDFEPALRCLLGAAAALSPSTMSRLTARFKAEYEDWTKSSLASLPIVYVWVDGIYIKAGIADERACVLVVMGADVTGQKHLLALEEGFRESKESWSGVYDKAAECLLDDLDRMFAYYDYPAEQHKHLRTTNPIESIFASVRLRTNPMKRLRSARSAVYLIFQLARASGEELAAVKSGREVEIHQLAQRFEQSNSDSGMR